MTYPLEWFRCEACDYTCSRPTGATEPTMCGQCAWENEACGLAFDHGRLLAEVARLREDAYDLWDSLRRASCTGLRGLEDTSVCRCGAVNPNRSAP